MCDKRSISAESLVRSSLKDDQFVVYFMEPEARNDWYYFPLMSPDEVLLIKTYDSAEPVFVPPMHSAFADPATPPDAPTRRSMESGTAQT